jgi:hypothetical protein
VEKRLGKRTDTRITLVFMTENQPLYQRVLGNQFDALPHPIRAMHDVTDMLVATGRADVDRGGGIIGWLIGKVVGFPQAGRDVPVTVRFAVKGQDEIWTRTFGTASFSSRQAVGKNHLGALLVESFGPFAFAMALVLNGDVMRLIPKRWTCLGIPLPLSLAPFGDSYEFVSAGRFNFHVEIRLPLLGTVVAYRGWLEPAVAPS